jgi:hypothetical protein
MQAQMEKLRHQITAEVTAHVLQQLQVSAPHHHANNVTTTSTGARVSPFKKSSSSSHSTANTINNNNTTRHHQPEESTADESEALPTTNKPEKRKFNTADKQVREQSSTGRCLTLYSYRNCK